MPTAPGKRRRSRSRSRSRDDNHGGGGEDFHAAVDSDDDGVQDGPVQINDADEDEDAPDGEQHVDEFFRVSERAAALFRPHPSSGARPPPLPHQSVRSASNNGAPRARLCPLARRASRTSTGPAAGPPPRPP